MHSATCNTRFNFLFTSFKLLRVFAARCLPWHGFIYGYLFCLPLERATATTTTISKPICVCEDPQQPNKTHSRAQA